ncbi:MAG: endonuclease NucS [Candidatus Diapherotrites archaeon]|nr:endonuclease NucS [Candidatus Diapherotrites archaeon]
MDLTIAKQVLDNAFRQKQLCMVIGNCKAEYWGRAASKLSEGDRMLLIKGDGSFAIHQNKLLRPVNYMMSASMKTSQENGQLVVLAEKLKPKESLKVFFSSIDFCQCFEMHDIHDVRLFGSEKQLQELLGDDLSFIEPGLTPLKREAHFEQGFADIIAEDSKGRICLIEVKRRKASLDAVSQLHRYQQKMKNLKNKEVRALLLAPEITENAKLLADNYGIEFFKLDFEISNPSAKIKGIEKKQTTLV